MTDTETRKLALDIFKQLVEINTTETAGNVTMAIEAIAQRLRARPDFRTATSTSSATTRERKTW